MKAEIEHLLFDYPDPSQAFDSDSHDSSLAIDGKIDTLDRLSASPYCYPDPSLLAPIEPEEPPTMLVRVSDCLDDALRLFEEGNSEQACMSLAEANGVFDSCSAHMKSESGVAAISAKGSTSTQAAEPVVRALAATA